MSVFGWSDAFRWVLAAEGGYSATMDGGTNKGIRQSTYAAWLGKKGLPPQDVKNITDADVETIYREEYWLVPTSCEDLPSPLNIVVFDSRVQHGAATAAYLRQACAGWADVSPEMEAYALLSARRYFYGRMAREVPSKAPYLKGWLNRIDNLRKWVGL